MTKAAPLRLAGLLLGLAFANGATAQDARAPDRLRLRYETALGAEDQRDCLYEQLAKVRGSSGGTAAAPDVHERLRVFTFTWPTLGAGFSNRILDVTPTSTGARVEFYDPVDMPPLWRKAVMRCDVSDPFVSPARM